MDRYRADLDYIYDVPNPFHSYENFERYTHADLVALGPAELRRESARLRLRLTLELRPPAWLLERLAAIEAALGGGSR